MGRNFRECSCAARFEAHYLWQWIAEVLAQVLLHTYPVTPPSFPVASGLASRSVQQAAAKRRYCCAPPNQNANKCPLTCCAYMLPAMSAGLSATPGCCWPAGPRAWPPRGAAPCCWRTGPPCCIATGGMPACGGTTTGTAAVAAGLPPAAAAANEPGRCACGCPTAGITGSGAADLEGCCGAAGAGSVGAATAGLPAGGAGGCTGCATTAGCAARCCSLAGTTSFGSMSPNLMEGCLPAPRAAEWTRSRARQEGKQTLQAPCLAVTAVHACSFHASQPSTHPPRPAAASRLPRRC